MTPIISEGPWNIVQMDCVDMRSYQVENDGKSWILNILDCYSKFLVSFPMLNKSATSVCECLKETIYRYGPPAIIQTDNGKEFVNIQMVELLNMYSIVHKRGRPRHPENQGQVERVNQTIGRRLAKCLADTAIKRWVDVLQLVVFKYNTIRHRAINMPPIEAFLGRSGFNNLRENTLNNTVEINDSEEVDDFIYDLNEPVNETIVINPVQNGLVDEEYRYNYLQKVVNDHDVHYRNISFEVGDAVIVAGSFDNNTATRRSKMEDFFEEGIWTIVGCIGTDSYQLSQAGNDSPPRVVKKNRLKKVHMN